MNHGLARGAARSKIGYGGRRMASPTPPEPLTAEEVRQLKEALATLIAELGETLEGLNVASKPVTLDQQSVGRVSRIDAIQQQHMSAAGKRSLERRLQQAKRALTAMEEGSYGACLDCEEPIGYARLTARPETPLCLSCQRGNETR